MGYHNYQPRVAHICPSTVCLQQFLFLDVSQSIYALVSELIFGTCDMTQKTMHSQQASSRAAPYLLHDLFEHLKLSFGGALLSENSRDMLRPQVIPSSDGGPPLPHRVPQGIPCPTDVLRSFGPSEAPQRCRTTSRIEEGPWWILPHWKRQARLMWFWVHWRAGWYMEVS